NQATGGAGNSPGTAMGGGLTNQGTLTTRNTILAGNTVGGPGQNSGPDLGGNFGSQGYNLIGDPTGGSGFDATDLLNVDPLLGPLQDNGGPTQTMALLPGSPAVDAGDNANAPDFDQRGKGFDRIVGGTIDIGAFEAQIGPATSFQIDAPNSVLSGMPFDVTVTALDAYNHVANGYTGTVTFSTTDLDKGVVLPADYTFAADEGGVHKFTDTGLGETTLITPGDQTITATDTKDDSITANAMVTVTGGDGPRMGRGNLGVGFNWMGSVFGSPFNRTGLLNSESLFLINEVWNSS
ncbi:MAG TPA: choice-of-anchor Q domain-containing protein, partial [Gemmataceae bacterium]|nr:choice-of-anchor Q domain-containing protein [Gemmataceae bacterium]